MFGLAQLSSTAWAEPLLDVCTQEQCLSHECHCGDSTGMWQSLWLHTGHGEGTGSMAEPLNQSSPFPLCQLLSAQGAHKRLWSLGWFCSKGSVGPTVCGELLSHHPPQSSLCRNLDTIITLPGGESLRGFILVTLLVEKAAVPGIKVGTAVCWALYLPAKCLRCTHKVFLSPEPGLGKGQSWHGWQEMPRAVYTDIPALCDSPCSSPRQSARPLGLPCSVMGTPCTEPWSSWQGPSGP